MELALKPADCPLANVLRGIDGEVAYGDTFYHDRSRAGTFDNCYNDRSHADIRADYFLANPPYANFPWVRRWR